MKLFTDAAIVVCLVAVASTHGSEKSEKVHIKGGAGLRAGQCQAKQARLKAANRQRRLIFNDDSEELRYKQGGTREGFLSVRLRPLAGTQVDTICWSVLGICGDAPVYDSKVQPIFGDAHGGVQARYPHYAPNVKALIETGHGPLRIVTDFAHQNGMEAFASIRMNDIHDAFPQWADMKTLWKQEHPEFLVKTGAKSPPHRGYVSSQDYVHREVRDRKFEIIAEVCERYDIDGVELDYMRHPCLFSSVAQGMPAKKEEVEVMTSFMRRIRKRMDEIAAERKRPLLLAARVPDSFVLSLKVGLDVKTWFKEDLVDLLFLGGCKTPFSLPLAEVTRVAHEYGVPVYPCMNWYFFRDTPLIDEFREGASAMAQHWFDAGADGVYLWNLGTSFLHLRGQALIDARRKWYGCLKDIGDPSTLERKDKLYLVDRLNYPRAAFHSCKPKVPLPFALKQGAVKQFPIEIGDDIEAASRAGALGECQLRMKFKGPVQKHAPRVRLNGEALAGGELIPLDAKKAEYWMHFSLSAPPLKKRTNVLEASLAGGGKATVEPVELRRVRLSVKYK